ncbi:MAG: ParB/RepB/Spo0J family partition protein [Pararhodobacter sp.]|nr:ParB/RepB/Spo0J family partition protein [Pararhodobacter sp.]
MSDQPNKRRGLGRGLSALMAEVGADLAADNSTSGQSGAGVSVRMLPIEALHPNPNQPRRNFAPDAMRELTASIRERGILQPLIARPLPDIANQFQIVAGERRWRAAQQVPLHEVPVILRELTDNEVLEIAIIENIQREDLDPIEEAQGYRQLIETFGHTQEKLAEALGKSRSYIANLLRLLQLPGEVQTMLIERKLTIGHARALITAPDPLALAQRVIADGLSVRETEALTRSQQPTRANRSGSASSGAKPAKDADTRMLESDLSASLGMGVVIDHRPGGEGRVTIRYHSLDQLDQLCQLLSTR